jgi:hypothetical protein
MLALMVGGLLFLASVLRLGFVANFTLSQCWWAPFADFTAAKTITWP